MSIKVRNFDGYVSSRDMYKLLRSILFLFPAEGVHHFSMQFLKGLCAWWPTRKLIEWACLPEDREKLGREVFGLRFPNPVGLGAGFDKNALYLRELAALGFGFVEIGTVTPLAQDGNPQPRLFRLPQDQALINRMGFNNDGVEVIAARVRAWRGAGGSREAGGQGGGAAGGGWPMIVGGNLGKNKDT